jgi:hypothetical protein
MIEEPLISDGLKKDKVYINTDLLASNQQSSRNHNKED